MTKHIASGLIFVFVLLYPVGCSDKPDYKCRCARITNYEVSSTTITPDGIEVDASGLDPDVVIDLDFLDEETSTLEWCLDVPINRAGFVVKIAPDWHTSSCSGNQVFPCNIPPSQCSGTNPNCPCACGGAVQPSNIIVVTPNLATYRHELIHLVANTADHNDPRFAHCENSH